LLLEGDGFAFKLQHPASDRGISNTVMQVLEIDENRRKQTRTGSLGSESRHWMLKIVSREFM